MATLVIAGLLLFLFVLAAICIHRTAQVTSLKRQVEFLEYSLEQLTEKEEDAGQDLDGDSIVVNLNKNAERT